MLGPQASLPRESLVQPLARLAHGQALAWVSRPQAVPPARRALQASPQRARPLELVLPA